MALLPKNIKQYRKFLKFMIKYRNSSLFKEAAATALDGKRLQPKDDYGQTPEELVRDLKNMGPTYVKLGQLLSTRPDLLPDHFLKALSELQDNAEPIPFKAIKEIIEDELGTSLSKAFHKFEEEPIASASIGQVHKATLPSGTEVAVKIQRPGITDEFIKDFDTLEQMAKWAVEHTKTARKFALDQVIRDLRRILLNELNYEREVRNLLRMEHNLESFEKIKVPKPILDYSTSRIITMEYIEGQKIINLSPVKQTETDCAEMAEELVGAYLKQVIEDGFVHADPHPGNIHFTKNYDLVLLDLGMVTQISPRSQEHLLKLMAALGNENGEEVADILIEMGELHDDHDLSLFKKTINRLVMENQHTTVGDMKTGRLLIRMNQAAGQNGIILPIEINILGKVLLNLDQIIAVLAPDFNLQSAINRHTQKLMQSKMLSDIKPESLMATALESKKLAEALPHRLNKFTRRLANNEYVLKIDAIDEKRLTDGFQKVANRITLGLILAAMIVGAAMLMNVDTAFTVLGYPGLAMIFFLLSAVGGALLTYYIIFKDEDFK